MFVDKITFELALEALPEGIVLLDENKRIQFFNRNALAVFPEMQANKFLSDVYHQLCLLTPTGSCTCELNPRSEDSAGVSWEQSFRR